MRNEKFLITGLFFLSTPLILLAEIFLLQKVSLSRSGLKSKISSYLAAEILTVDQATEGNVLAYSKQENSSMDYKIVSGEARPLIIKGYLAKYNSPLAEYSNLIFESSQENGLDYRLIVAIAQQESNLCKKSPPNCFNCWGVGIHSKGTMCFDSYPEAIKWFARYLRREYYDKGLSSPEEMMKKYCPHSNGSWAFGVTQFMDEMTEI